ncbi:S53 family peptidase [Bdellovibrionota bacterium FG-1]
MQVRLARSVSIFLQCLGVIGALAMAVAGAIPAEASSHFHRLSGHVLPFSITEGAKPYEPFTKTLQLAIRLSLQNPAELDHLIERLYSSDTSGNSQVGAFLTPSEFTQRFGATIRDYERVSQYFEGLGCQILATHPNRLLLDVECSQAIVQRAFRVRISHWLNDANEVIRTVDRDPSIPNGLAIEAIHGLTTVPRHPHVVQLDAAAVGVGGSGPNGGMSPSDIKTAYNLNVVAETGAGQTLALFELDGYRSSDVTTYKNTFGISPGVPLQNILVAGFNGSAGPGAAEVTLDIDLMMALAPHAAKIIVYEGPNSDAGVIDVYQRIANDNAAKQVSTSWGIPETYASVAMMNSENQILKQMAVQGQTVFAASGDSGAMDNGTSLSVDDPASQPFLTGVGGTTLTTQADHTYVKETTWWTPVRAVGGGGGMSAFWPIPSWQTEAITPASGGSFTHRNVPDVALNADPTIGYSIFVGGKWNVYGGTSCAAPLWAAFTALVNQRRVDHGIAPLGLVNPVIYQIGMRGGYAVDFHDIADASTNGHYPAVAGYDLATGWGSLIGANLLAELSTGVGPSPSPSPSATPSPTLPPPPSGSGCNGNRVPASRSESAGAAMSFGLPFMAAIIARRGRKSF